MTEYKDQFNAKDFWPDAERMLDAHFRRKRIIRYSLITAALLITSSVLVFLLNREAFNPSTPQTTALPKVVRTEATDAQENSNTQSEPTEKSVENTENLDAEKSVQYPSTRNNGVKPEKSANDVEASISGANKKNNRIEKSNALTPQQRKSPQTQNSQRNENLGKVATSNSTEKENYTALSNVNRPLKTEEAGRSKQNGDQQIVSSQAENSKNENAQVLLNAQVASNTTNEAGKSDLDKKAETVAKNGLTNVSESLNNTGVETILPLNFLSERNSGNNSSMSPIETFKPQGKSKRSSVYLDVQSGVYFHQSRHLGGSTIYQDRRNQEESDDFSWMHALHIRKAVGKWLINTGLESSSYGEKTQYVNSVDGFIATLQNNQVITSDSLVSTRFNYYLGNEFSESVVEIVSDTLFTQDTLKVAGKVAGNLPDGYSNGRNRYRYVEIPLSLGYTVIDSRRFRIGLQAGVSAAILQSASGFMINQNNTAFLRLEEAQNLQNVLWNFRGGLRFDYAFINGISVFANAEYRGMLRSVFQNTSGLNSRYSSAGISLGLSVPLVQKP